MAGLVRLAPGELFASRFEVVAALAEGGMGTVYEVLDQADGRKVALKVLLPELVAEPGTRRRFTQEAQIAAQIDTPYVPQVFSAGIESTRDVPWIAMELLEGDDLRRHVHEVGALSLDEARPILEQVGLALGAAHRRGLVHRDLKPENVFLHREAERRVVKLLDFGVAKVIDLHRTSATGTGAIGSPMWMAPEQTSAGGRIAPATDVWAYGLLAFFVLTGRFYWKAAQDDSGVGGLLREIHLDPLAPASERGLLLAPHVALPEGFDAWFDKAMQRSSIARFRDATEALDALQQVLGTVIRDKSAAAMADQQARTEEMPVVPPMVTAPMGSVRPEDVAPADRPAGSVPPTTGVAVITPDDDVPTIATTARGWSQPPSFGASPSEPPGPTTLRGHPDGPEPMDMNVPITSESVLPEARGVPPRSIPPTSAFPRPVSPPPAKSRALWFGLVIVGGLLASVLSAALVWALLSMTEG